MTSGGPSGTAIRAIRDRPATSSCAISTCPADASERLSTTLANASTRCAALRPARCRPLARFGSCPRATCAITPGAKPIPAAATCGICASRDSISTVRLDGRRDVAVVLTDRGRDLLESHRGRDQDPRQEFYAGLKRERELEHDAQVYEAYLSVAERLDERHAHIERVVLDYELKREYQQWLHERDRDRDDYDGHPDRDAAGDRAMGARTRPSVLRRAGPFPRPADRIRGDRRPPRSRACRGGDHPLPRRPRRRSRAVRLHVLPRDKRSPRWARRRRARWGPIGRPHLAEEFWD